MLISSQSMPSGSSGFLKLFKTNIPVKTSSLQVTLVVMNVYESPLPHLELVLYFGEDNTLVQASGSPTPLENGWYGFTYDVPFDQSANERTLTTLGLRIANPTKSSEEYMFALGQLKILDKNQPHPTPLFKKIKNSGDCTLSWKEEWKRDSRYRVYGLLEDDQPYLLGIVYNDVYSPGGNIFNATQDGFTEYIVQEVNKFGDASPLTTR